MARDEYVGSALESPLPPTAADEVAGDSQRPVRIFISSPRDVKSERSHAREVLDRLHGEFGGTLEVEHYLWEDKAMRAGMSFQDQIEAVSKFDICVCIMWSRLGNVVRGSDKTGTQTELEAALASYDSSKKPEVFIYRRVDRPKEEGDRNKDQAVLASYLQTQSYLDGITQANGENVRAYKDYDGFSGFCQTFKRDMDEVLTPFSLRPSRRPASWLENPFQGLLAFEFQHAPIFCGRAAEIERVIKALETQARERCAFVLVHGASGAGKSSLVRAGVLPRLVTRGVIADVDVWRWAIVRPANGEGGLFDALAQALLGPNALPEVEASGLSAQALAGKLRESPSSIDFLLHGFFSTLTLDVETEEDDPAPVARLALVVDQLEELFTDKRIAHQREPFLTAIDALARSGKAWVIATLRSDFYVHCHESPILDRLLSNNQGCPAPNGTQLGEMIRFPATAAGLQFDYDRHTGRHLLDLLRDEALANSASLPLLEFALDQLYRRRDQARGMLLLSEYDAMGGLKGVIGKRAQESYEQASPAAQSRIEHVFRTLVAVSQDDSMIPVRRRVRKDELVVDEETRELVDRLAGDRLLVLDREGETPVVSIAHEALLECWPLLKAWTGGHREYLRQREIVTQYRQRWLASGKSTDFLCPPGQPLEQAERVLRAGFLLQADADFVELSSQYEARETFRASLTSGEDTERISQSSRERHPEVHQEVLKEQLRSGAELIRSRAIALLTREPGEWASGALVECLLKDANPAIRHEAATALVVRDRVEGYRLLASRWEGEERGLEALGRLRLAVDAVPRASAFEPIFEELPPKLRSRIIRESRKLRFRRSAPTLLMVLIPTLILSSASAGPFKAAPGYLNYALAQGQSSFAAAIFQGVLATFLWGGMITLCVAFHGLVFATERSNRSWLRPWGTIVAGVIGGILSSLAVLVVITKVSSAASVVDQGWTDAGLTRSAEVATAAGAANPTPAKWNPNIVKDQAYWDEFWNDLLWQRRYAWPYMIQGIGLGIGMAMLANAMRSSMAWRKKMRKRIVLTGGKIPATVRSLARSTWKLAWPIPVFLLLADALAFLILRNAPGAFPGEWTTWRERLLGGLENMGREEAQGLWSVRNWKMSAWGQGLALLFDSMTQGLGGFFCIVGMGLGLVGARNGVTIEARKN
jgi:hypothetical protein